MSRSFPARRLALFAAVLAASPAAAQTVLTPGHPDLTATPPQRFDHQIRVVGDVPRLIGQVTQEETLDGDRLTVVIRLVIAANQEASDTTVVIDTTVVSWPSLTPVRRASIVSAESSVRLAFADGRIVGRSVTGNLDEPIDVPAPADTFGEGVEERIARSVPLRNGYVATFGVTDRDGFVQTDTVRVVGQDGGAWLVEVASPSGPTYTYTVDAATRATLRSAFSPRAGITMEFAPPPAAE